MDTTAVFLIISLLTNFALVFSKRIAYCKSPCFLMKLRTPRSESFDVENPQTPQPNAHPRPIARAFFPSEPVITRRNTR